MTKLHSFHPTSFVTLCWDNNDTLEETPSGMGTTHCTNGIAVQRRVQTAMAQPLLTKPPWHKSRRRSVRPPQSVVMEYITGVREGPLPINIHETALTASADMPYTKSDFAWAVARLMKKDSDRFGHDGNQKTPAWAGFHS